MIDDKLSAEKRPGCVTIYALGAVIVGFLAAGVAISFAIGAILALDGTPEFLGTAVVGGLVGISFLLPLAAGIGLWRMANWGRKLAIVFHLLLIGTALFNLLVPSSGLGQADLIVTGVGMVIMILINGAILAWFVRSGARFR